MKLYVPTMEAVLVDVSPDGRVRFEDEDWTTPTLQHRRAILHAARQAIADLEALLAALEQPSHGV
jgi:hypothetical protein